MLRCLGNLLLVFNLFDDSLNLRVGGVCIRCVNIRKKLESFHEGFLGSDKYFIFVFPVASFNVTKSTEQSVVLCHTVH